MSDLLTVAELVDRIKEQNGAVVGIAHMDWILRTGGFYRRALSVGDIPKIMNELLEEGLVTNTDMKPVEPPISECKRQDNVVKESRSREVVIADYVGDAIMAKVFDVQHEMGRQELYSEQIVENCL